MGESGRRHSGGNHNHGRIMKTTRLTPESQRDLKTISDYLNWLEVEGIVLVRVRRDRSDWSFDELAERTVDWASERNAK